jgi:AAA domain
VSAAAVRRQSAGARGSAAPTSRTRAGELGSDGISHDIEAEVNGRGPFVRYDEDKSKSLTGDIARIITKYDERHPNRRTKVEICTDIVPWDPTQPPPVEWSVDQLIAKGSVTSLVGDSGALKSFMLWNLIVSRMYGEPFANRNVSEPCAVMVWLAEGKSDYRQRCRAAVKAARHDPNDPLPLISVNEHMLPLMDKHSEEQLAAMIDKGEEWAMAEHGMHLGMLIMDTISMVALFKDSGPSESLFIDWRHRELICCLPSVDLRQAFFRSSP